MSLTTISSDRVPAHTAQEINERIENALRERVAYYADHRNEIASRLRALDAEWDIERAIEANASSLALAGLAGGILRHPAWLAVPVLVAGFLLQHALQGWCPPVPLFRRLGFRTVYEIERERQALKALRGDFENVRDAADPGARAFAAVRP